MRRLLTIVPFAGLCAVLAVGQLAGGCATYQQDLERAERHYDENQFEKALALFRVLEPDIDSFEPPEQAKYAYYRGMTDYRLSSMAAQGTNVADPRRGYRDNSRHWLAVAIAIDKKVPGGLTDEQKQRANEALNDLNRDYYGGAETGGESTDGGAPDTGTGPPAPAAPAAPPAAPPAP